MTDATENPVAKLRDWPQRIDPATEASGAGTPDGGKRTRPKARAFWKSKAGRKLAARYRAEYRGRSQPKNFGRTGPGRKERGDSPAVPTWQIARALISGESERDTAARFKMKETTVRSRANAIRLAYGSVFLCDQGILFRDKALTAIRNASGTITAAKFEELAGFPPRSTDKRPADTMIRTPDIAKAAIAWRDKAIRALVEVTADRNRPYKNHEVIHTFLPDLASLRDTLAETFTGIQTALREHPDWQIADVWNFVCNRVQQGAPEAWHRTMCYLWEIESILASKISQLRDTESIAGFVCEVLGERYGTTDWTIVRAMRKGQKATRRIPPREMLGLVLTVLPSATAAIPPKPRGARKPRKVVEQTRKYKLAQALFDLLPKCQEAIKNIHACKRFWPGDRRRCESEARRVGFGDQAQIDLLIESKTAEAAAAKIIAIRNGLTSRAVQNAWSVHGKSFQ